MTSMMLYLTRTTAVEKEFADYSETQVAKYV